MIEIVSEAQVTQRQLEFVRLWSNTYFRPVGATEELQEAPVHWRVFLWDSDRLVGHVAVTRLQAEVNGVATTLGAIGGLFTIEQQMGRGFGSNLMAHAENLVFNKLELPTAILFCLPDLVSFYERRKWCRVETPVTLQQTVSEIATWPEEVMVLSLSESDWSEAEIHVL